MPQHSRILAPFDDLIAQMISHSSICENLFELSDDVGFERPSNGLLVVKVPEDWWRTYGEVRLLGPGVVDLSLPTSGGESPWRRLPQESWPSFLDDVELRARFRWFAGVAPPPALVSWLSAAARAAGAPIAYYHWEEHGDDLYYEFALLFDALGEMALLIRQTFLVDTDDNEEGVRLTPEGRSTFVGFTFAEVLEHIGSPSRIGYFPPDDRSDFDWEICRVSPHARKALPGW